MARVELAVEALVEEGVRGGRTVLARLLVLRVGLLLLVVLADAVLVADAEDAAIPMHLIGISDPVKQIVDPEDGLLRNGDQFILQDESRSPEYSMFIL